MPLLMENDIHLIFDELSTKIQNAWIAQQIREELQQILATKGSLHSSECHLAMVGDYLVFALSALSELANVLVHGASMIEHLETRAAGLLDEPSPGK